MDRLAPVEVEVDGLKEKFGRALTDPRDCDLRAPMDIGLDAGGCCDDCGLLFKAFQLSIVGEGSADRAGKTKSGFGMSSTGPVSSIPLL